MPACPDYVPDRSPSVAEVAALTRRLRELSAAGRHADPAARAAFLADKQALLARIDPALTDPGFLVAENRAAMAHDADHCADDTARSDANNGAADDAGWSR